MRAQWEESPLWILEKVQSKNDRVVASLILDCLTFPMPKKAQVLSLLFSFQDMKEAKEKVVW